MAGLAAAYGRGSMTNSWQDIGNATCIIAWGANPAENHPACMAHINRARYPKQYFASTDSRYNKAPAKLIVVDPRKTRTALQADAYVRIRPGTNIALANAVTKYLIDRFEALPSTDPARVNFFAYLNQKGNGTFFTDGSATTASGSGTAVPNQAKYTDARFIVNAADDDYERERVLASTGATTATGPDNTTISDFPKKVADVSDTADPNHDKTVYARLKAHLAPYTAAEAARVCGCAETDVALIGDAIFQNCRHASYAPGTAEDPRNPAYRATTILYAMGITQHTTGGQNVKAFTLVQGIAGNMGRAGGGINALRGIHNVQGSTDMGLLYANIPGYSYNPTVQVDGGTDWRTTPSTNNAFGKYMDGLWGNPISGTGGRLQMNQSYDDCYNTNAGIMNLQQRGFFNMNLKWFGDYTGTLALSGAARRAAVDATFSLWPKGNGLNHIKMFRNMKATDATKITALVCWGQNPAVTEPNQGKIRDGLKELDLLVTVDMFETETGACDRKATGVTILIPTAAHVEKAGSVTNSGRALQWRYAASAPAGNTKDDTELLLRFAKSLDVAGAFSHIKTVWENNGIYGYSAGNPVPVGGVYDKLYKIPYTSVAGVGGFDGVSGYGSISGTGEIYPMRKYVNEPVTINTTATLTGSEWANECGFREYASGVAVGGTVWLYTEGYDAANMNTATGPANAAPRLTALYTPWGIANRAKSRDAMDPYGTFGHHKWGYSWLVNRRVLYNNSEVSGDQADFFMSPDSVTRLFAPTPVHSGDPLRGTDGNPTLYAGVYNYSRWYRTIIVQTPHVLYDKPVLAPNGGEPPKHAVYALTGRFPCHTEPYETPRADLAADWGFNSTENSGTYEAGMAGKPNLVYSGTKVAGRGAAGDPARSTYPLVMTTIRCVEHFQGGPITRNNWSNVELEPEPWIEINSADARAAVPPIKDGDMVRVVTARTDDFAGDSIESDFPRALYGAGFRARVGTGLSTGQRVAPGVVAIPWHWGDRGLSTGSRANDLCIDAMDANTTIPESKACLCRIEKM